MAPKIKKKKPKKQIQVYTNPVLTENLEKARHQRELELRRDVGPVAKQTLSSFICAVLFKHLETKMTYDMHHRGGGWRGYWDTIQAAVAPPAKKKEKRS